MGGASCERGTPVNTLVYVYISCVAIKLLCLAAVQLQHRRLYHSTLGVRFIKKKSGSTLSETTYLLIRVPVGEPLRGRPLHCRVCVCGLEHSIPRLFWIWRSGFRGCLVRCRACVLGSRFGVRVWRLELRFEVWSLRIGVKSWGLDFGVWSWEVTGWGVGFGVWRLGVTGWVMGFGVAPNPRPLSTRNTKPLSTLNPQPSRVDLPPALPRLSIKEGTTSMVYKTFVLKMILVYVVYLVIYDSG